MAYQSGHRWHPDYYNVGNKRLLLDPAKTWQENVWYFVNITAGVWLARARVWSYDRGLIEELEQTCRMRTYLRLRDIVCNGKYDRRWSFYHNCRGCAWAAVSNVLAIWKRYAITIPDKLVSIDAPIDNQNDHGDELTLADTISPSDAMKLRTTYDTKYDAQRKCGRKLRLNEVTRGTNGYGAVWRAVTESEWDNYVQNCEEFGIEPIEHDEFIRKNFPPPGRTAREKAFANAERERRRYVEKKKKEQG